MTILGIDPGTTMTALCGFDGTQAIEPVIVTNGRVLGRLGVYGRSGEPLTVAIETISSYGMPVGAEVFQTCEWIGRFHQVAVDCGLEVIRIPRGEVKLHLCQSARAKDANIRQALLDRLGPVGTKKNPGALYGVKSHIWSALAVAVTAWDRAATASAR